MTGMITTLQLDFLRLLTRTGFATNAHIQQMQIGHPTNSKHNLTKRLLDGLYIGRVMVSSPYGFGRRVMYYLTKKGAEFVADVDHTPLDEMSYTNHKGGIQSARDGGEASLIRADFPHKEKYICAFLELENHLKNTEYEITNYHHYYQLQGEKNTILTLNKRNFKPDGIWFCEPTTEGKPVYAYVVEIHRHSERKRIVKQLRQHVEAFQAGSMADRFGITYPYFVLSIFAEENTTAMKGIIAELQADPETWAYIEKFFMFATITDVMADFYNAFGYFGGNKKPIPLKN